MSIETMSITGDAVLFFLKGFGGMVPMDAECAFVRVDQNTRQVFIDYLTEKGPHLSGAREGEWNQVVSEVRRYDIWEGLQRVKKEILSSARRPNTRPPGVADNWWYGQ